MPTTVRLEIQGLKVIRRVMRNGGIELYAGPWREGMIELASKLGLAGQRGAPVGKTGKMQLKTKGAVQRKPFPTWVAVRSLARTSKGKGGYPYPLLLNYQGKWHHFHWLQNALQSTLSGVPALLDRIGHRIEQIWEQKTHVNL